MDRITSILLMTGFVLIPLDVVEAQTRDSDWDLSLRTSFARSYLDHDISWDKHWGTSASAEVRLHFADFFHFEVAYTRESKREENLCPLGGFCPPRFRFPANAFSAGGGIQAEWGGWMPFAGVGRGRIWNERISRPTWVFYSGLGVFPFSHLGGFVEYRATRAERWEATVGWNWALGFGVEWLLKGRS